MELAVDAVRARYGMIIPSSNRMAEPHMARYNPEGVVTHTMRVRMTGQYFMALDELLPKVAQASDILADSKCDPIVFHCTANSMAEGIAGPEIFTCKKHAPDGEDYGFVGEVMSVNTTPLEECISKGITPVISPTGRDEAGQIYNCNADIAAAQAAIALAAKRLVFMSDVPGLLRDPENTASVIPHLNIAEVDELKQTEIIAKGMIPKVDSAVAAINAGVDKVSFVDGRINHAVLLEIFTDKGVGTEIVK